VNTTFGVEVSSECIFISPAINVTVSTDPPPVIYPGSIRTMNFTIAVTNQDEGACQASNFQLRTSVPSPSNGWVVTPNSVSFKNMSLNETRIVELQVTTRENLPPGKYELNVGVDDGYQISHRQTNFMNVSVSCPQPRPVRNLKSTTFKPFFSFGLQAGPVFLEWEGCTFPQWCCCPCQYKVARNGEKIGESSAINFTDTAQLEIGVKYVYSITVVDKNGVESSAVVCDNTLEVQVSPPSLKPLGIFMACSIAGIAFLGKFVFFFFIFCCLWS
jgi:hypothetical protein